MVRKANATIDAGHLKADDVPPLLAVLQQFDEIFAVLDDDDAAKMKSVLDWAHGDGREGEISKELDRCGRSSRTLCCRHRKENCPDGAGAAQPKFQRVGCDTGGVRGQRHFGREYERGSAVEKKVIGQAQPKAYLPRLFVSVSDPQDRGLVEVLAQNL